MAGWQTIHIFISSTFLDMQAERDVLVKRVFPSLRARLEPYRVRIVEVDLRWGITSEQERSGNVLNLCLEMIDKSRPYFIGLLGDRYGSVLNNLSPGVLKGHPWLPGADPLRTSVTELEVLYGVLNHPVQSSNALFYLRDPVPLKYVSGVMRGILADLPDQGEPQAATESDRLRFIAMRLDSLGIADSKPVLQRWLKGEWLPRSVAEALTPRDRLDLLKMRLRDAGVVSMDGYPWSFDVPAESPYPDVGDERRPFQRRAVPLASARGGQPDRRTGTLPQPRLENQIRHRSVVRPSRRRRR
jgi:hypothetical protein